MIKISLIKWLIHFFGFKKSAIDATFTSIELSKSTTQAYNATSYDMQYSYILPFFLNEVFILAKVYLL